MNYFEKIQSSFFTFLEQQLSIPHHVIARCSFELNCDEDKQQFGDINSNIAMVAAKELKTNPRQLAQTIIDQFQHDAIATIEIAGPGFLNFTLHNQWYVSLAQELDRKKDSFFSEGYTKSDNINIEFISANPTGPLHIGHGRNGILGDVLATLYQFLHQKVSKEFYINDAGVQITKLGQSFKIRCLQELGQTISLPEDAYHGEYLTELAKTCIEKFGDNIEKKPDLFFETYAKEHMLAMQQETLERYGIIFQTWFSEKTLHDHNKVEQALQKLIDRGYTYTQENALWFKSTEFGDDKDRVLKKSNGDLTYVAADVAYLIDKFERGYTQLFMILGHDHHSYKTRLHAIMQALGYNPQQLTIILYQLVHLIKDGKPARMSKRTGNMFTLSDIIDEVGKNVSRFFFLNRKADAELEFDIDLALSQSNENPIFYIQYAYVRTHSIYNKAQELNLQPADQPKFEQSLTDSEKLILKKICSLKTLLHNIADNHQIHLIAYYAYELASLFQKYYNTHRVIEPDNMQISQQRLNFILLVQQTLQTCFYLMGITPLKKM
ncbi:MAG: arginine--tRNA ligase [Epsilonproteobacteria bacterium]|nr:arginine--tRNA ligase [Campylobacterota bacterium]